MKFYLVSLLEDPLPPTSSSQISAACWPVGEAPKELDPSWEVALSVALGDSQPSLPDLSGDSEMPTVENADGMEIADDDNFF